MCLHCALWWTVADQAAGAGRVDAATGVAVVDRSETILTLIGMLAEAFAVNLSIADRLDEAEVAAATLRAFCHSYPAQQPSNRIELVTKQ